MRTEREKRLKNLLITKQIIEAEIKKDTKKLVFSKEIPLSTEPNYQDVLEALRRYIHNDSFRWVDLEFCFSYKLKKFIEGPNVKIKIFLLGNKRFIIDNLKEIAGRIVAMREWKGEEAVISFFRGPNIKDLI